MLKINIKFVCHVLGIDGRGAPIARCVLTKVNETLRTRSSSDGNGAKWPKFSRTSDSSDGIKMNRRINQSYAMNIVFHHRSVNDILSVNGKSCGNVERERKKISKI